MLFLQNPNFELQPLFNTDTKTSTEAGLILFIGALFIAVPVFIGLLIKKIRKVKAVPIFNKENFFNFASKSGISREAAKYLFQHIKTQHSGNQPMLLFFNYTNMLQVFKAIYQQEKSRKKNNPIQFQENISYLIDAIDRLEEHFQSVSAILSTYLIPPNTKVFLSNLNNDFRIQMSVNRSTPRALILNYKYSEKNDDTLLRKADYHLTLWLLDNKNSGYAAYNVKLKKIRNYQSTSRKEYFLSHSWHQEVPNITRRHKRSHFAQQGYIKLLSPPLGKNSETSTQQQIKALIIDISLGGCSIVLNPKYQEYVDTGQQISIHCSNPLVLRTEKYLKEESYYQFTGHITKITSFSDKTYDGFCNIHIKFGKLEQKTRNSLGLFIYGLENVRLYDSSPPV